MIRVLDASTVERIAAGEVVERPSSVAKELIENALDAGATAITVEIADGGIEYLRVTDNGCGINPSEARMAFENHATSKILSADDLDDIRTFGFRGEALPSIASVAKVEMMTRVKGAEGGVKLRIEGGKFLDITEAGCPEGTTIIIRNLFFNTPVRQTFLKKPTYEAGVVIDLVQRLMLGNPDVSFRLINNKKTICQSYGDGNMRNAALSVYGRETAGKLLEIDQFEGGLRLKGLIGVGDCAKANRSGQSFYINGRLVRCLMLSQILEGVCRERVTIGMVPMCALQITLPPHSVDVNVHPNKYEVRFRDEANIRLKAETLLNRFFAEKDDTPILSAKTVAVCREPIQERHFVQTEMQMPVRPAPIVTNVACEKTEPPKVEEKIVMPVRRVVPVAEVKLPEKNAQPAEHVELPKILKEDIAPLPPENDIFYRLIGVVFNTYLLLETDDALVLIDQHAAHERILYDKFSKALESGAASQQLLIPIVLNVTKREQMIIEEQNDLLREIGYEIEAFGNSDILLRAVPFILGKAEVEPLFMEMIDRLDKLKALTIDRRRSEIMQLSCKKAIKGGDRLSDSQIKELLHALETTKTLTTCPHGRPILRVFARTELEHMFKRIQ